MSPPSPHRHNVVIDEQWAGWRLDRALAAALPEYSRERLKSLVAGGQVMLGETIWRDPARKTRAGEHYVVAVPAPAVADAQPQDIPLTIVHEDAHLLVVDKPAGLVVHPACGNLDGTLVNALLHHCAGRLSSIGGVARPGIVHRIDKDTSGLLVVAKTDPAHTQLSRQFAAHSVERAYAAFVAGIPRLAAGRIEGALARSTQNRQKMAIVEDGRGKPAVTNWRLIERLGADACEIECRLETGRTHQIRVHMSSIGHPLIGDPAYGRAGRHGRLSAVVNALGFARQALHARTLGFEHPVTGTGMRFESPLPMDMVRLRQALKGEI